MKITWDQSKRLANLVAHGLDFVDAETFDWEGAMVLPSYAGRYRSIGDLNGTLAVVVFAPLGSEAIAIISMRRASRKERILYGEVS